MFVVSPVILLTNEPVVPEMIVLAFKIVGFELVLQQTPLEVTSAPLTLVTSPPLVAAVAEILVIAVVDIIGVSLGVTNTDCEGFEFPTPLVAITENSY